MHMWRNVTLWKYFHGHHTIIMLKFIHRPLNITLHITEWIKVSNIVWFYSSTLSNNWELPVLMNWSLYTHKGAWLEKMGNSGTWFLGNFNTWREILVSKIKKYIRNIERFGNLGWKFWLCSREILHFFQPCKGDW